MLPFYYCHMPSMTGPDVPVAKFLATASKRIPNLAGIKFTFDDLDDFSRCLTFDGGRRAGSDCSATRPPLANPTTGQTKALRTRLDTLGCLPGPDRAT